MPITTIHFGDLNGNPLPDGDKISVTVASGVDPNTITISLVSRVTWWKGIQANEIVLCQTQDGQNTSSATVDISQVHDKGIQLWKAKSFGEHLATYDVTDIRAWAQGGKVYTFLWEAD